MDESNNMQCNPVPEPKSIANLIDELLNVGSRRHFSQLSNWQIVIAGTLLLLVWLLGPNLIDLGISIMCFVILSSIAYILVIFACKLPGMCDNASKQPVYHYNGPITHVEGDFIQKHTNSVDNSDNRISNQSSSNKTNIATEVNVTLIPKGFPSSSSAPIKYLERNIGRPSSLGIPAPSSKTITDYIGRTSWLGLGNAPLVDLLKKK